MKTEKGQAIILVLVGILVMVAVAAGAYYFGTLKNNPQNTQVATQTSQPTIVPSSSPDETANWETYRNELFNYSFDYPAYLKVEDDIYEFAAEKPEMSNAVSVHLNQGRDYGNAFKVLTRRKDSKTTKEIASNIWQINKEDKNPNIPQKIVSSLESATFKGKPSYKFLVTSSVKIQSWGVLNGFLIDRENTVLFVDGEVFVYGIIFPSSEPLANQILSTFKFLPALSGR